MQITLYKLNKRSNSTLRPSGDGKIVNVQLKQDTSIYSPVFLLSDDLSDYNYLKWDNRYYYIDDFIFRTIKNVNELRCSMDLLATYKTEINNTSAFVLYSTSDYDVMITDTRLSTDASVSVSTNTIDGFTGSGGYVVSVIGPQLDNVFLLGASNYYLLMSKLMDAGLMNAILSDPSDYLSRHLQNTYDCVRNAIYLPLLPNTTSDNVSIRLAKNYDTNAKGKNVSHSTDFTWTIPIPWQFSDFRNRSQYTSLLLYLPAYGVTELNADDFIGQSSITIKGNLDGHNGDLCYMIGTRYKFSCNIAVPQYGAKMSGSNPLNVVSGAIGSAVTGLVTQNYALAGVQAFNAIASSMTRNVGSIGSSGGGASFNIDKQIHLTSVCHSTNVAPSSMDARYGRPLNAVRSIGSLSGYVQTSGFSLSAIAPQQIKDDINNMMDGGVYLE